MSEFLSTDFGRLIGGAGIIVALVVILHATIRASNWSLSTYRSAGQWDHDRVDSLQRQVDDLNAKVDRITADYRRQRELKHDWRSFASSLIQERWTIRRFATLHDCVEVIELMDQLDEMRRDHPLMADVTTLLRGEPE